VVELSPFALTTRKPQACDLRFLAQLLNYENGKIVKLVKGSRACSKRVEALLRLICALYAARIFVGVS
jgi:hypothetical protein